MSKMGKQKINRGRAWFAVHTYAGYEHAVRQALLQRIESLNMQDKIFDVLVPEETQIEIKRNEPKQIKKRIFPGYVLVDMIVTDDSWYVVRNTPHVTGFIGAGTTPVPVTNEEVDRIKKYMGQGDAKFKVDFVIGDIVKIAEGPFATYEGKIAEIDKDRGKVKVMVQVFGRETPVELNFAQVKKVV